MATMSKMMMRSSVLELMFRITLTKLIQLRIMLRKTKKFNKMMSMCGIVIISKIVDKI